MVLTTEGAICACGVTADDTMFNHALIGLDEKTIGLLSDVLEECSYVHLKEQLIRRLSVSEEAKLEHLLN